MEYEEIHATLTDAGVDDYVEPVASNAHQYLAANLDTLTSIDPGNALTAAIAAAGYYVAAWVVDKAYGKIWVPRIVRKFTERYDAAKELDDPVEQMDAVEDAYRQRREDLENMWAPWFVFITHDKKWKRIRDAVDRLELLERQRRQLEHAVDQEELVDQLYERLREEDNFLHD